jgi:hypothetical protein
VLPWAVAAIALVAIIAMLAGQRFGQRPPVADAVGAGAQAGAPVAPFAGAGGGTQAPDISNMTPTQRAVALYNLVMSMHERGSDSAQTFAPMAIQAYQMIDSLTLDDRYDMGRIAAIAGQEPVARAQADTILAADPTHLLGLILAANAAHMRHDTTAARVYQQRLVAAAPSERAKPLEEYTAHANDITVALDQAKGR